MSCFNFIIMKVNGADVSNLPYEDAVKLFLNAEEPIIVEVRRKCLSENNKLSFFNYDDDSPYKSPTLAVIASSSSASTANAPMLSPSRKDVDGLSLSPKKTKPAIASISCQTDLSAFDAESNEIIYMKTHYDSKSDIFFQSKCKPTTTKMDVIMDNFDDYLKTDLDFEEITLIKSRSAENLGFTISYSTDDLLASDSGSDEYDDGECIKDGRLKYDKDYSLLNENNEKCAARCKIYVSDIIPNSLADQDGRLRQGDRILQINGQNVLEKVDPDKLLTEKKYSVKILVSRYGGGDDDFLDSAVYCDDKECQGDKHISSNEYEYEQNTFSSSAKSSCKISKHDQTITDSAILAQNPVTNNTIQYNTKCQISPSIASESVCDSFSHANIKVQLETVSKEISLLNSQISVMKQLQTETSMSLDKQQQPTPNSSPKKVKKKTLRYYNDNQAKCKAPNPPSIEGSSDVLEHIYETIPEDADSDVYYCSPFEGVSERRVEEWLKSIGCPNSNVHSGIIDKSRTEIHPARLQKQNSILDDYDNSSSAYNTGGSCSSAFLALESSKPNMDLQNDRQNSRYLVSKSLNKTNLSSQKHENSIKSNQRSSVCRKLDISINNKCQIDNRRTQKPSTVIPFKMPSGNTNAIAAAASVAADSDGHSTLVAKSSAYRMCQSKAIEECKEKEMSGMVWKVKRRPDGSRYIVRRVIKKHLAMTENNPETATIQSESASAVDFDYKRQLYGVKERSRNRHRKAPATPSKEKPHSQHWLV